MYLSCWITENSIEIVETNLVIKNVNISTPKRLSLSNMMLQTEIEASIQDKSYDIYLFVNYKGEEALSTTQVYRILNDAADYLGR